MTKTKLWFSLMWKNGYILIFSVFLGMILLEALNFDHVWEIIQENSTDGFFDGFMTIMAFMIPIVGIFLVVNFGFIQFWKEIKK